MRDRQGFLLSLAPLREYLLSDDETLQHIIGQSMQKNPWFERTFVQRALKSICHSFLDIELCAPWLTSYSINASGPKRIGLVMAGNIPLVGFHDVFCVLASGHTAVVKLSDKDSELLPHIISKWISFFPALADAVEFVDRLDRMDAVIATGSDNSLRYFEYYFKAYPHLFRKNRNGVAVLDGNEDEETMARLMEDVFLFFGLGCRNVSKIYVPEGYSFEKWSSFVAPWDYLADHNKYRNNLDYNFAIYIINQVPHIQFPALILKEDAQIASRIGCLNYSFYSNRNDVLQELESHRDNIQCVVSSESLPGWEHVMPGQTQQPALGQYADGLDTMAFLATL